MKKVRNFTLLLKQGNHGLPAASCPDILPNIHFFS